ncbi:GMP reductase 1 isoform X2 [Myotis myotis]|uniref:GMP reductase 1 isoform X2 n=1 Tax=Myotis myotis TaxID=51298 RepID=UPI001747F7E2|nr:GMP reductase 1 isoform X2 [Myotis myotis]
MPRIDADLKLDFKDVLLRPKRSSLKSRSEVDLERTFTFRNSKQTYSGIPIIVANMDTVGTFEMAAVMSQHSMFTAIHKHYTLDDWKLFATDHPECLQHVAVSSGSGKHDLEKMSSILEAVPQVKFICLDVANGYSEHFVEFVKLVRARFPEHTIMAGNVVTGEMVEELILSGADIIKVGVGPGSVCTTRTKTGVGYPQLSAVIECADSAHGLKGHIISSVGGQDRGSALQRRRRKHDPGYSGRTEVYLHLRGGRQAQRAQQEDDVHPSDPAAQHGVRLTWGQVPAAHGSFHTLRSHPRPSVHPSGFRAAPERRDAASPAATRRRWGPLVPLVGQEAEH